MNQNQARRKALNQKRDEMLDLFTDSRIKVANKPTTFGEFYDYVTDLDREAAQQAKRVAAKAKQQAQAKVVAQKPKVEKAKVVEPVTEAPIIETPVFEKIEPQTSDKTAQKSSNIWDDYSDE